MRPGGTGNIAWCDGVRVYRSVYARSKRVLAGSRERRSV